jgi:nucleotide-binding universal stress UspA family protein
MFDTIVLGHDGSEEANAAVPIAADLARRYDSVLLLVHIREWVPSKGGPATVQAGEDEIREELDRQAQELSDQGVTAKVEVHDSVLGGPAHVLEHIADRMKAELIVVGRHGHSQIAGLLLGSVTQRLLHISKRAVLAAPSVGHG